MKKQIMLASFALCMASNLLGSGYGVTVINQCVGKAIHLEVTPKGHYYHWGKKDIEKDTTSHTLANRDDKKYFPLGPIKQKVKQKNATIKKVRVVWRYNGTGPRYYVEIEKPDQIKIYPGGKCRIKTKWKSRFGDTQEADTV